MIQGASVAAWWLFIGFGLWCAWVNAQTPTARAVRIRWLPGAQDTYVVVIRHSDGTIERLPLPEVPFERTIEVGPGDCALSLTATNAAGESEPSNELALPGGC